jgi:hypothetical protein
LPRSGDASSIALTPVTLQSNREKPMTIRTSLIAVALATTIGAGSVTRANAQARVDGADVLRAGIYKVEKPKAIDNPDISTGHRYEIPTPVILRRTTVIPAIVGTVMGLDFLIRGTPRDRVEPFRIVWRYPEPGIRNPNTGKFKLVDDYIEQKNLGRETSNVWILGQDYTLVPGRWTFEIWHEGRMLATQSFTLVKE